MADEVDVCAGDERGGGFMTGDNLATAGASFFLSGVVTAAVVLRVVSFVDKPKYLCVVCTDYKQTNKKRNE